MSNRLDDSVGSESIAEDGKSIHVRINSNSINACKIKIKSDLQNDKDNYNNKLENQQLLTLNSNNFSK